MADAAEIAAILEEFTAAQRAQALGQARLQKIVFARQIGEGQLQFEAVIEDAAEATEIYATLAKIDAAADRLKAKFDLNGHYARMLNICGQIEMSQKKLAEDVARFNAENGKRSEGRRVAIVMTSQQDVALQQHQQSIRDGFDRMEESRKAAEECRRILDGEDPFKVMADQIEERIDQLRGSRAAAA